MAWPIVMISKSIYFASKIIQRSIGVDIHKEVVNMKRHASAVWQGGLKDGKGSISTASGVLSNTQYSFSTRFEDAIGTNPEEMIEAAHAGCFSMALSGHSGTSRMPPDRIHTTPPVTSATTP